MKSSPMRSIGWMSLPGLAVAVLGLAMVAGHGASLLSSLYVQISRELLARPGGVSSATAAAAHGQMWAPWRIDARIAEIHTSRIGRRSIRVISGALRWAPSDARLWAERQRLLVLNDSFGVALAEALRNINELAPSSWPLQLTNARIGVIFWDKGDSRVRQEWMRSLRFVANVNRRAFVQSMRKQGLGGRLCWIAEAELRLDAWCGRLLSK